MWAEETDQEGKRERKGPRIQISPLRARTQWPNFLHIFKFYYLPIVPPARDQAFNSDI
jgi:hypothetical protein